MKIIVTLTVSFVLAIFWWLLLEGKAPSVSRHDFEIDQYRQLVDADLNNRPIEIRYEIVGTDVAPGFAAETWNFGSNFHSSHTATQIVWPTRTIIIDAAVDQTMAKIMQQSDDLATYDPESFDRMIRGIDAAESVWITHAHPDHVMGIAQHPDLQSLANKLMFNSQQIALWGASSDPKLWPQLPSSIVAYDVSEATLIAPGVVLIPTAGHTPGSQSFYIQLQDKREYLMIGDLVWSVSNIENLKTRPRFLNYFYLSPPEDRAAVLSQIKALNNLTSEAPDLMVLPSHDTNHLNELFERSDIVKGFLLTEPIEN